MVDCLVFSKDRAAQLDLLLRSIDRYVRLTNGFRYASLVVLWDASASEYEKAYRRCIAERRATFWREYDFEKQVRHWLDQCFDLVSFLVDDDVFYREPEIGYLPWSMRGGDYDYPFSLDGVVYGSTEIKNLLEGLRFSNPTELEATGHEHRDRLPFSELIHGKPCLTSLPWNRVSKSSGMPSLGFHEYDLNERFLAGERLALPEFAGPQPPHTTDVAPVYVQ